MSNLIVEVCKIESIKKHPNADKLSVVKIKGWNVVVGLNQYNIKDLIVFVPPDSIIPPDIIIKYNLTYLKNGGRVGITKLRGYISEGLILDVPEGNYKVGDNVADILGITKYVPPEPKYQSSPRMTSKKKLHPYFDKYTEIENIKNYNNIFNNGDIVVVTEKIHGTSSRYGNLKIYYTNTTPLLHKLLMLFQKYIMKKSYSFIYGSHNVQLSATNTNTYYGEDVYGKIGQKYNMKNIIPNDYIIYGEIYGLGVQDLTYGINEKDMRVFDIKKVIEKQVIKYQNWEFVKSFCDNNGLKYVPELYVGDYYEGIVDDFVSGNSTICATQIREGIVIKCLNESTHPLIGRKILKALNPEYLLRQKGSEYK